MLLKYVRALIPYGALIIAITIWGGLPTLTKLALDNMTVLGFIAIRFIFSSLLLSPYLLTVIKKSPDVPLKYWLILTVIITLMFYSQTWAIQQVAVSWYVVIFSITPVIMALCLRYRMHWQAIVGVILVGFSLLVFLSKGRDSGQWHLLGLTAVIVGMLCWVGYSLLVTRFHHAYSDIQITAITAYIAALVNVIIWLINVEHVSLAFDGQAYFLSAIAGVVLPIAFWSYSYALRRCPKFSVFGQYLEPALGLIIANFILGGTLMIKQYIAFVFILIGVIGVTRYSSPRRFKS